MCEIVYHHHILCYTQTIQTTHQNNRWALELDLEPEPEQEPELELELELELEQEQEQEPSSPPLNPYSFGFPWGLGKPFHHSLVAPE